MPISVYQSTFMFVYETKLTSFKVINADQLFMRLMCYIIPYLYTFSVDKNSTKTMEMVQQICSV